MFRDRRRLRRWTVQLLFAWLFGLTMAVANACALAEPVHAHAEDASAAAHDEGHSHDVGDQGNVNCLDFCAKSSIGSPKLKLSDDTPTGQALAVLAPGYVTPAAAWSPADDVPQRPGSEIRGSPPLRIALRRLAL